LIAKAVEVSTSQAKRLGASSNLYIIEGRDEAFVHSSKTDPTAIKCEITTRECKSKNRVGYLSPNKLGITVDDDGGLRPRLNHQHQWEQRGNRWYRR